MRRGHAHNFELNQLHYVLWYLQNLQRMARMKDLIRMPYDTNIEDEIEVYQNFADAKHAILELANDDMFIVGAKHDYPEVKQRIQWIKNFVEHIEQSLGKDGVHIGLPHNLSYQLPTEFPKPDFRNSHSGYTLEMHCEIYRCALQAEAYSWMCSLDKFMWEERLVFLPIGPAPFTPASGNLYEELRKINGDCSYYAMLGSTRGLNSLIYTYLPRYIIREFGKRVKMIDDDLLNQSRNKR